MVWYDAMMTGEGPRGAPAAKERGPPGRGERSPPANETFHPPPSENLLFAPRAATHGKEMA